eukprot:6184473-Pleurochrysis_carterae.AAC.1
MFAARLQSERVFSFTGNSCAPPCEFLCSRHEAVVELETTSASCGPGGTIYEGFTSIPRF